MSATVTEKCAALEENKVQQYKRRSPYLRTITRSHTMTRTRSIRKKLSAFSALSLTTNMFCSTAEQKTRLVTRSNSAVNTSQANHSPATRISQYRSIVPNAITVCVSGQRRASSNDAKHLRGRQQRNASSTTGKQMCVCRCACLILTTATVIGD